MPDGRTCSHCGAELPSDAPRGFCPRCLYRLAIDGSAEGLPHDPTPRTSDPVASAEVPALPRLRQFGDYELLEEIGHDGMGVVSKARQRALDRIVALKLLLFGPYASPESVKRFRAEAVATAALQHPNIVAIHEVGFSAGQHFMAMDYVEGHSLSALLQAGPWPARRAAGCVKQIAEAIHYAHEHGILHRDLKPANVLIDANDQPRLTDFGLARRIEGDSELTVSGQVLGSPHYMPPEQASGRRGTVSRRSDVYALGAILYHTLTGRPPFMAGGLVETVQQVLIMEPLSPRWLDPRLPADLETVCLKCLEKEPAKRYPTALALAEDLARYLNGQPVSARPIGPAGKVWRWCRRNPRLAAVGGLALLSVLLGFIGISWQWRRAENRRLETEAERTRAEAGERAARRNAYAADISADQRALEDDDLRSAWELLNRYRPPRKSEIRDPKSEIDLRGWEWRYLWACCQSDEQFWDVQSGEPVTGPLSHLYTVRGVEFSPDGNQLLTVSDDKSACLWELAAGGPALEFRHRLEVTRVVLSPDQDRVLTASADGTAQLWNLRTGKPVGDPLLHLRALSDVVFSPDGERLLTASFDRTARVWRASTGAPVTPPLSHEEGVVHAAFSPDGRRVATASSDKTARVWDAETGQPVTPFLRHDREVQWVAFSPDGQQLVTASRDRHARVWDATTGKELLRLEGHGDWVLWALFSPDGRHILTGSADMTARIWDAASGASKHILRGHSWTIFNAALNTDGTRLVTASADRTARIWDAATGQALTPPLLHGDRVEQATFSRDGRWVVTGSADGTVRLWNATTGHPIAPPIRLGAGVPDVQLTGDGRRLAAASGPAVHVLDLARETRSVADLQLLTGWLTARVADLESRAAPLEADRAWQGLQAKLAQPRADELAALKGWHQRWLAQAVRQHDHFAARFHVDRLLALAPADEVLLRQRVALESGAAGPSDSGWAVSDPWAEVRSRIPPRAPGTPASLIDLSNYYNRLLTDAPDIRAMAENYQLSSLARRVQTLGGVTFDVRGWIQLQGSHDWEKTAPERITGIGVALACRRLHFLHGAILPALKSMPIARFVMHYADGQQRERPVRYGGDVLNFVFSAAQLATNDLEPAWTGTNPVAAENGFSMRLYRSVWENPRPEVPVQSIDFISNLTGSAPFLIAITAE